MGVEITQWISLPPAVSPYILLLGPVASGADTVRDTIRYEYEHSILPYGDEGSKWDGKDLDPGHRVSIMIRVSPCATFRNLANVVDDTGRSRATSGAVSPYPHAGLAGS